MKLFSEVITEDENFIFDNYSVKKDLNYYKKRLINHINAWKIKHYLNTHPINYHKKKYNTAIAAIFKNEAPYLREWIEFHKIVGIEHFYLYNNNSDDNGVKILEPYVQEGLVTLKDWPMPQGQIPAYRDVAQNYQNEVNWIAFIDIDEFIIPNIEKTVNEILEGFKNRPSVYLYWNEFGSSGLMRRNDNKLVIEDFTLCFPKYMNIGKVFWNTVYDIDFDSPKNALMFHWLWCVSPFMEGGIPPVNLYDEVVFSDYHIVHKSPMVMHLNHYYTKSFEEFSKKLKRSDAFYKEQLRTENDVYWHDIRCTKSDFSAYRYLIKLKQAINICN